MLRYSLCFLLVQATVKIKGEAVRLCELEGDLSCLTFLLLCKDFEVSEAPRTTTGLCCEFMMSS